MQKAASAADCPMAPPAHASVYAKALHRACLIVGGIDPLSAKLKVARRELEWWMLGEEVPPEAPFLAAVEIILLYASAQGASRN